MNTPELNALADQLNAARAGAVAAAIDQGQVLVSVRQRLAQHFPGWCTKASRIPLPEAELLMRAAAKRPQWINPQAVDLSDPLVEQLEDLALLQATRVMGVPVDQLDQ